MTLLIPFVLGCALIADRAQVAVSTGGKGALALLAFIAPLCAMLVISRYGEKRSLGFIASPTFVLGVLPYLVLTGLLPALGVMFNGYPDRTLFSITTATTAFSFLILGAALSTRDQRAWSRWLLLAIAVQLIYSAGQAVYLSKGPGWELFTPFHEWDLSLQALNGVLVQGRGIGLYVNPNELGFWAGAALVLAWTMLPSRLRALGVVMAVLTLLLSQSRGATVGVLATVVTGALFSIASGRLTLSSAFRTILTFAGAAVLAAAIALAIEPSGTLVDRFAALLDVWARGPQADPNLAGRLDYWAAAAALNNVYPWGTLGAPETILGTAVDSEWFRAFAQGSVLYVAALALLLVAALTVRPFRHRHALRLMAVLVAAAGITQTPFSYPVVYLFWVLLGGGLQASVDALRAADTSASDPTIDVADPQRLQRRSTLTGPRPAPGSPAAGVRTC